MKRMHSPIAPRLLLAGLAALALAACDDDGGTEEQPWQIVVSDQDVDPPAEVVVDRVVAQEKAWVVIHADDAGNPGEVIGFTGIARGETTDVTVTLDRDAVNGETLHAMLHVDAGQEETYEFPGQDVPVEDDQGNIVMAAFTVTGGGVTPTVPTVVVGDQTADPANEVVVSQVVSDGPGWIVVHADDAGSPGAVIGFTAVADGVNDDVAVTLDRDAADGETLHAMLHTDAGTVGTYEFPGDDGPVVDANGDVVMAAFVVTVEGAVTPSVTVDAQTADPADEVVVAEVVSDGPGWIVIHEDGAGSPGPVIGFTAVADGTNTDVVVTLDRDAVDGETLYAMLHTDAGTVGTYEFPGDDGPVLVDGSPVSPAFVVTVEGSAVTPSVTVDAQTADPAGEVVVAEVVSDGPGWIVIHEDGAGSPGPVIGFTAVADGTNTDVVVTLDRDAVDGETLYAMLHTDAGTVGTYEFPGDDGPVLVDGSPVSPAFVVTVEDSAVTPSVTVDDQTADPANEVVVAEVVSDGPGWIIIHEDDAGSPGAMIGSTHVADGVNTDVAVTLDRDAVDGETLYAMLYTDAVANDVPVLVDGSPVSPAFVVTVEDVLVPSVIASDQTVVDVSTLVTVDAATSDGPGWIVIHEDDAGAIGDVIGHAALTDGDNADVEVVLDRPAADGETLYAMLHMDAGEVGTYEFPGADVPVLAPNDDAIAPPFVVTVPAGTPAILVDWSTTGLNWYLVEVTPDAFQAELGPLGTDATNPDITLREGWRYEMVTDTDVSFHPWVLRNSAGGAEADLLYQGATEGAFESDADVAWVETVDAGLTFMRFTLTSGLAAVTDSYWCGVHTTSMEGAVTVVQP